MISYITIYLDDEFIGNNLYYDDFKEITIEIGDHIISGTWTRAGCGAEMTIFDIEPETVFISTLGLTWAYQ